jgi:NAD(P)-dependent dehydrogenase (short-subunit alcohol dehydrogenase family)
MNSPTASSPKLSGKVALVTGASRGITGASLLADGGFAA